MTPVVRQLATGGFDNNFSYVIHDPESGDTTTAAPRTFPWARKSAAIRIWPPRAWPSSGDG
jgi:hypothetical protein